MIRFLLPLLGTTFLGLAAAGTTALAWQQLHVTANYALPEERVVQADDVNVKSNKATLAERPDVFYSAITERPLFSQTRRPATFEPAIEEPVVEVVEEKPQQEAPPPNVALHGVSGSVDNLRALLSIEDGAPDWFLTNAIIQQWVLSEIGSDWIVLRRNDKSFRVELYKQ
ncbi:MAG: hypothetical protein ABJ251_00700 [Paracoccaceae bacterium]